MEDDKNKERIAQTFRKHFEQLGFKKTSVDEVARELHISKKTVYRHFTSKERVFLFIMEKIADGYCRSMAKEIEGEKDCAVRLHSLLSRIFEETRKWSRKNDAFEFRFKHELADRAFSSAYQRMLLGIVKEGKKAGVFRVEDAEVSVGFIQSLLSKGLEMQAREPEKDCLSATMEGIDRLLGAAS
jgi:TetR/AcrR family transcriptional regulator